MMNYGTKNNKCASWMMLMANEASNSEENMAVTSATSLCCFDRNVFFDPHFKVDALIMSCRHGMLNSSSNSNSNSDSNGVETVSLERIQSDLSSCEISLRNELIELINKEYADFVNLSSNLVGVDGAINELSQPMSIVQDDVKSIQESMIDAEKTLKAKLAERTTIRSMKAKLQLCLNVAASVEKIEKLMRVQQQAQSNDDGYATKPTMMSPSSTDNDEGAWEGAGGQLIERVASEFNQLQFYMSEGRKAAHRSSGGHTDGKIAFLEQIQWRVDNVTNLLLKGMEATFERGLATGDAATLTQCLRTYAISDRCSDAELFFRTHIVAPFVAECVTKDRVHRLPGGLQEVLESVLELGPRHCDLLLSLCMTSGLRGFDFVARSLWPEVCTQIIQNIPFIFAPGIPDAFHRNYSSVAAFTNEFEALCVSQESVTRVRTHPASNSLAKKWSLSIYFQLRFQTIATGLEEAMLSPLQPNSTTVQITESQSLVEGVVDTFALNVGEAAWVALRRCWEKHIFLIPLAHRFWKLFLQIISRYTCWAEDVVTAWQTSLASQSDLDKTKETTTLAACNDDGVPKAAFVALGSGNNIANAGKHSLSSFTATCLLYDINLLSQRLTTPNWNDCDAWPCLSIALRGFPIEDFNSVLADSATALNALCPRFYSLIIDYITAHCIPLLAPTKSIPGTYRMTNRDVPTKPSAFVAGILQPLVTVLSEKHPKTGKDLVTPTLKIQWATEVVTIVTNNYLELVVELISTVKKTEESLLRLKKRKARTSVIPDAAAPSEGVPMSDEDKIRKQLWLDVVAFGENITAFDIDTNTLTSFIELTRCVKKAGRSTE